METNKIATDQLRELGQELLDAAFKFWKQHQKECGSSAVVWLKGDDDSLVVFTRGEYKGLIMSNIDLIKLEEPRELKF